MLKFQENWIVLYIIYAVLLIDFALLEEDNIKEQDNSVRKTCEENSNHRPCHIVDIFYSMLHTCNAKFEPIQPAKTQIPATNPVSEETTTNPSMEQTSSATLPSNLAITTAQITTPVFAEVYTTRTIEIKESNAITIPTDMYVNFLPTESSVLVSHIPILQTSLATTKEVEEATASVSLTQIDAGTLFSTQGTSGMEFIEPTKTVMPTNIIFPSVTTTEGVDNLKPSYTIEPTGTVLTSDIELITKTEPPSLIQPTETVMETVTPFSHTVVATSNYLRVDTFSPATQHIGVIEPTPTMTFGTVPTATIQLTSSPLIARTSTRMVTAEIEPTSTSIVVEGTTVTPSLPSDLLRNVTL